MLAVPLFNKIASYTKEKVQDVKEAGQEVGHKAKVVGKVMKAVAKEIPQRIEKESDGK